MKHRPLVVMLIAFVLAIAGPADALPRQLASAGDILAALKAGGVVRVVLHDKVMSLVDGKGQPALPRVEQRAGRVGPGASAARMLRRSRHPVECGRHSPGATLHASAHGCQEKPRGA